jgi:UDP-N-acetylmuramate dehydrogenase
LSYAQLTRHFEGRSPDFSEVREAVIALRESKLPAPAILPNAGSFFKNPMVSIEAFEKLSRLYPEIPGFPSGDKAKLSAGWLIEQSGLKGKIHGPVSVYEGHALVMINLGGADLTDVLSLKALIVDCVFRKFDVKLEQEPLIVNQDNSLQIKG